MNERAERFPLVDALRAVAALLVLVFHAAFVSRTSLSNSVLRPYTARLDVGVTIFFLISGFLLYRPFVRARLRDLPAPSAGAYFWRRFLRIVPAYWVALTVVAALLSLPLVFTHLAPYFYGFAQIYYPPTSGGGIAQAWTLDVEVTFYLMLPLYAAAMRLLPRRRIVAQELVAVGLLFLAGFGWKVFALQHTSPQLLTAARWLDPLPNFLDHFAIGMGLAVLTVAWEGRDQQPRLVTFVRRYPTLPWLAAAFFVWFAATQLGLTGRTFEAYTRRVFMERHYLYAAIATFAILPAIWAEPGRGLAGRLLAGRTLRYLGLISYGIYLYHLAVIEQIDRWMGSPLDVPIGWRVLVYTALGLLGAVLFASASYYLVERPALRLKWLVRDRGLGVERGEATLEPAPVAPATATAASTTSATSAGWRKRGTP